MSENHRRRQQPGAEPVWRTNPQGRGIPAFRAAIAARRQGEDAYERYRLALQRARHEELHQVDLLETQHLAARQAGLDVTRWERDREAADLSELVTEHEEAVSRGVFGVPTLVWPEGRTYYLKVEELVLGDRAVELFEAINAIHRFGEVIEIKTPESEGTLVSKRAPAAA